MTDLIGQFQHRLKFYTGILFIGSGPGLERHIDTTQRCQKVLASRFIYIETFEGNLLAGKEIGMRRCQGEYFSQDETTKLTCRSTKSVAHKTTKGGGSKWLIQF